MASGRCSIPGSKGLWNRWSIATHSSVRSGIATMLGRRVSEVVVRTYPGLGHYGRSNGGNAGSEDDAVSLSRAGVEPVRVQWMCADDMQWSTSSSTW